ncbi:uncharacterized protein RJT21DRAFT_87059 [Scheffersomyces amazonensis]|uniref:uncharacterized protein n=1 Tax=Scheffersomyces amazonensis TaxID=1078765 RepID=UPI00315C7628
MSNTTYHQGVSIPNGETSSPNKKSYDVRHYYRALINEEFRGLQLDSQLKKKSLFDLIDYCEMLYESASSALSSINTDPSSLIPSSKDIIGVRDYIKGFLIFNYFINSFIMLHFKGFDTFIKSNEQDFIIYLNVFAFYNTEELIINGPLTITLGNLRLLIKQYLVDKNLLSFNVDELYNWLYEYIEYLKEKDKIASEEPESEDESSLNDHHHDHDDHDHKHIQNGINQVNESDSLLEFKNRFPSMSKMKSNSSLPSELAPPIKEESSFTPSPTTRHAVTVPALSPPPIPTELPPGLPLINDNNNHNHNPFPSVNKSYTVPTFKSNIDTIHKSLPEVPYPVNSNLSTEELYFSDSNLNNNRNSNGYSRPPTATPKSGSLAIAKPTHVNVHSNGYSSNNYSSHNNINTHNNNHNSHYHAPPQAPPPFIPPIQQPLLYGNANMIPNYMHYDQHQHQPQHIPGYTSTIIPEHVKIQQNQIKSQKLHLSKEFAVCGLRNFGSSCYINSTIQVMFGIQKFKQLFTGGEYQKFIRDSKYLQLIKMSKANPHSKDGVLLSEAVSGLLRTFNQNGSNSIAPTKFIRVSSLLKPDLNIPYEQQDAQEFLLFVLDRLHDELADKNTFENPLEIENYMNKWNINIKFNDKGEYVKWYKEVLKHEGTSPIHDLFQGHLQNKLICNKCGFESISYSQFTILSLPIPSNNNGHVVNLSDCLKYYTQEEVLSGDNAWNCPKCSKNNDDEQQQQQQQQQHLSVLDNHPVFTNKKSGIFKLTKRSKSPSSTTTTKSSNTSTHSLSSSIKMLNFIKLPQILLIHLSRFSMYNLTDKLETSIQYPLLLKFNNNDHEIVYKLSGLINHKGNLKSGHYTSLVNKSTTNQSYSCNLDNLKHPYWCFFDDDHVRYNLQHGNINQPNYDQLKSKDVYVLCYERI